MRHMAAKERSQDAGAGRVIACSHVCEFHMRENAASCTASQRNQAHQIRRHQVQTSSPSALFRPTLTAARSRTASRHFEAWRNSGMTGISVVVAAALFMALFAALAFPHQSVDPTAMEMIVSP
jgi:hypothetical protein